MPTEEERLRAKKGIRARQDAIKSLIEAHQAEFDELVRKNRVALGLSPHPSGLSPKQVEEKLQKARERVRKLEDDLRLATA